MKKVLSGLLALVMLLGCLPIALPVAAADTVKVVTVGDSITCGVVFPNAGDCGVPPFFPTIIRK